MQYDTYDFWVEGRASSISILAVDLESAKADLEAAYGELVVVNVTVYSGSV